MHRSGFAGHLTGCLHLFTVTLKRLLLSRQTIVCGILCAFAAFLIVAITMRRERSPSEFVEIVRVLHLSFLLPIFCLSYASAGIAAERDEKTLVYLLVSPLPRFMVYLTKFLAALLLAMCWTLGSIALMSWLAGSPGQTALPLVWPAIFWTTFCYVSLFLAFSACFRRATIISLVYFLLIESVLGNMPGLARRVAVSFYGKSMMIDATNPLFMDEPRDREMAMLAPISGEAAVSTVVWISAGLLLVGIAVFSRREYSN